jgi:uncharacterized repeat protein (TIGR01451 family)
MIGRFHRGRSLSRSHAARWLVSFGLVLAGWLAPGLATQAWAQTVTTCAPAATKGTDGPVDFGAYCWIDFTDLNLAVAKTGTGQAFQVNLRGGANLTFNLKITPGNAAGTNMFAVAVPSWSGAAFGNSAFNSIPGKPILYQDTGNQNAPQDTLTLSSLTLHANGSTELPFVFVAADGESSNAGETLSFATTGAAWSLVSAPGESNPARNMPTLSPPTMVGNSTGSQTVNIAGTAAGADGEGSYVFTTDNSPGTVTATMQGNGLQGVLFGVKYHTIGLSLTKTHTGQFKAGGTGAYTINIANTVTYPEINPPGTLQPIRVVDTLPTGLTYASASGTGWTCSAVGQVVTCNATTLQDLTTSKTFPPITINVNVASNAPTSLINNAEVSDPTTSTLVFNVCEVAANGVCPNSATSSTGDPTVIVHSDLSASTKSVVDLNGGDAQPGDVLEYTITLNESAGIAVGGVSVLDNMPANVGSLTVTSKPAGSTDSSTTTGGTNGTGRLNITGITVPASGSATVSFRVTIAAGTASGTAINNTATITNGDPLGTGASPQAATVTVVQAGAAGTGNKVLYLYNTGAAAGNRYLNRTPQTTAGTTLAMDEGDPSYEFLLTPALATPLVLTPTTNVTVALTVARTGTGTPSNRTIRTISAELLKKSGATYTTIGTGTATFTSATFHTENLTFAVPAGAAGSLAPNDQLALRITNTSSGQGTRSIDLSQYNGGLASTVRFDTSTVIKVVSVQPYANVSCTGSPPASYYVGNSVFLCAVVSDPFGSDDINTTGGGTIPSIVVSNAGGSALTSGNMTEVSIGAGGTKTFVFTYPVPATTSYGAWSAKVTAWEGTEHEVFGNGSGNFTVAAPPPNLVTSTKGVTDTNGGDALPGDVLRYTITLNETAGTAASNLTVVDNMPANVGSLVVISKPAGSTDTSTTTGGTNGTGRLNIGAIAVPANGSATIVFEVTIAAGTATGTSIVNTANVTNPGGTNVNPVSPGITVGTAPPVANGSKYLYLRNDATITSELRRTRPTNDGSAVQINGGTNPNFPYDEWQMFPAVPVGKTLALPAAINGNIVIATANQNLTTARTVRASLWTSTGVQLGSNVDVAVNSATPTAKAFNFTIAPTTLAAGQYLVLRLQNRGAVDNYIAVSQRNGTTFPGSYSNLNFTTTTVIKIDAAAVYSQPASAGNATKAAYGGNENVYVRATVSDPFGTSDISSVSVTIKDPGGSVVAVGNMTPLTDTDTTDGSLSYEFIFTVPTNATRGGWTAAITANEGVEGLVHDDRNVGFIIQGLVTLGKSWGVGATAGDKVNLTIGGALSNTTGVSTAGGSTTAATAAASGGTTLTLGEAFTSGSAGNYTVTLACTRSADGVTVAVTGSGLSRTIVMPSDSGVICAWSNSKTAALTVVKLSTTVSDPVNVTTNPKAIPGAIVEYQIIVTNPAANPIDGNTVFITDQVPAHMDLRVADIGAAGSGPVQYVNGSPASGLTYTFTALGNAGDDIAFSNDGGATWGYTPSLGADGVDPAVTHVRINPKGVFNANNAQFTIKLRMRIE